MDYKKLVSSPYVTGTDKIVFMHYEETPTSHLGLMDTDLMPHILIISKQLNGDVEIIQTEHTKKYLSA
ncbi:MAG: hypothetical protein LBL87_07430 [Ruminococcus sp.]|nr:hypothetical protein [Ruminococcus sp.]